LVSSKSPYGRRVLLPTEVEFCKLLNLQEDEYWYFQDTVAAYNGQRPEGYELIPDIRAEALSFLIAKEFLIQVGIAVAAATVSYLLTPKPKELKQGSTRRTADAIGNTKFAPQTSFDSVQNLASIGEIIPLVFANNEEEAGYGGVRVNSSLIWSQFVSLGKYQQLKALMLFSLGEIDGKPDYKGYGIGDSLLDNYNSHKVGLYFRNGSIGGNNRIVESDRYLESDLTFDENDPFEVGLANFEAINATPVSTIKAFSGARNPTTQTRFGVYSPIPNCQICRLPYELIRDPRGSTKEAIKDMMRKRKKLEFARWPTRAGIIKTDNSTTGTTKGLQTVAVGEHIMYQIVGLSSGLQAGLQRVYDEDKSTEEYDEGDSVPASAFNYRPHGVDDVDNLTKSIRENTDDILVKGEQYMFGTALVICIGSDYLQPWQLKRTKLYTFKVIEAGEIDIPVNGANLWTHIDNPRWYDPEAEGYSFGGSSTTDEQYSLSDQGPIYYQQKISGTFNYQRGQNDLYYGHDIYTGQRVAIASITNNRKCNATEIGIKSKVYKRIRFANVNSQPDEAALKRAFEERTQIQLGQVNKFAERMSLFMLQVKKIGDNNDWEDMRNLLHPAEDHTGLFAVKGNTPEFQYNAISIVHPNEEQYAYRFKPYPGNFITRKEQWGKKVNLLYTDGSGKGDIYHFDAYTNLGIFNVYFSGDEAYELTRDSLCNPEWQLGETKVSIDGKVNRAQRPNGSTFWTSPGFTTVTTTADWTDVDVDTSPIPHRRIKLWNETNAPEWAAVMGHAWVLYYDQYWPLGLQASQSGYDPGNANYLWRQVYFQDTRNGITSRYVPRQVNGMSGGHPNDDDHLFYVTRQEFKTTVIDLQPLTHFVGSVSVITRSGNGSGLKIILVVQKYKYQESPALYHYRASWSIDRSHLGQNYQLGDIVEIPSNADDNRLGLPSRIQLNLEVSERDIQTTAGVNFNPFDVVSDWNVFEGDENSNRNEPEHEIVYVNEILKPIGNPAQYSNLAFAGLRINSSKEWTNFSQFSAYFKKGIKIEKLYFEGMGPHLPTGASNLFPEIAYALLTNSEIGAGELVGTSSVDKEAMANAAAFCKKNKFFWDGTISSKINLRDFLFEHAGYCLLDFTIIGGKFSLNPSVPYDKDKYDANGTLIHSGTHEIIPSFVPEIKALFTDGNIKDLKVSFLSPEERQSFKAAVLYREEKENGFAETKSLLIKKRGQSDSDPVETFDLSGFCTSRQQAEYFAFFALNSRVLVDHGLTFKTAPQYVEGLAPGDYFRLVSEVTHTSRFRNGAVTPTGEIVSKDNLSGSIDVFYWKPGSTEIQEGSLNTQAVASTFFGTLFTVKNSTTENKVYKCETISYDEEGLLEVSGSYAPTDGTTKVLSVMQGWGFNETVPDFEVLEN